MKVIAFLVALALCQTTEANLASAIKGWAGKTSKEVDIAGACKAMGKSYGGMGWGGNSAKTTFTVTCGGSPTKIICKGSPFTCCESPSAAGSHAACANVKAGPKCSWKTWSCPAKAGVGSPGPADAKDALHFIALNNVFRCMHNVQPVVWDADVHAGAKSWAAHTGTAMVHSHSGTSYRKKSDGENLAGTFKFSKKPGIDATHMWYEEIKKDCKYSKRCYQTFTPGHFTAMMWSSVNKIAYSDTTGKLATGRYRGCDGLPPNYNNMYKDMIHPPVHNYEYCLKKVLACSEFHGITADDLDGCDSSSISDGKTWSMKYGSKCAVKYKDILSKLTSRLSDDEVPQLFQPLLANAGVLGLGVALLVVGSLAVVVRSRRRLAHARAFIDTEGGEMGETGEGHE